MLSKRLCFCTHDTAHKWRYVPDPKMDENFHIKSSIFGCLFSPISNHPNLDDYCLSFSIVADVIYNHPILDVSCRQFLDENYALNYHPILDKNHPILDDNSSV